MAQEPAKSTQTTAGGLAAAIGILIAGLMALLDRDPNTRFDLLPFVEAVGILLAAAGAAWAGLKARDDRVTSEGKVAPKEASK